MENFEDKKFGKDDDLKKDLETHDLTKDKSAFLGKDGSEIEEKAITEVDKSSEILDSLEKNLEKKEDYYGIIEKDIDALYVELLKLEKIYDQKFNNNSLGINEETDEQRRLNHRLNKDSYKDKINKEEEEEILEAMDKIKEKISLGEEKIKEISEKIEKLRIKIEEIEKRWKDLFDIFSSDNTQKKILEN